MIMLSLFLPFVAFAMQVSLVPTGISQLVDVLEQKVNDRNLAYDLKNALMIAGNRLIAKESKDVDGASTASFIRAVDSNGQPHIFVGLSQNVRTAEVTKMLTSAEPPLKEDKVQLGSHPMLTDTYRIANAKINELSRKNAKIAESLKNLNTHLDRSPGNVKIITKYRELESEETANSLEIKNLEGGSLRRTKLDACKKPGGAQLGACAEHAVYEEVDKMRTLIPKLGLRITHSGAVQIRGGYVVTAPRCDSCKQFEALGNPITDDLPASYRLLQIRPHETEAKNAMDENRMAEKKIVSGNLFRAIKPEEVDGTRAEYRRILSLSRPAVPWRSSTHQRLRPSRHLESA